MTAQRRAGRKPPRQYEVSLQRTTLPMIVTIDGPAGAGKSTTARELAQRLGFRFLDTGAMYRAVAHAAVVRNLGWDDPQRLVELARQIDIQFQDAKVLVDGCDVSAEIRTAEITAVTHHAANNPGVREHLVGLQRVMAADDDIVTEGRDQGTVVFPHAECKIFLTASPAERARRRAEDLRRPGRAIAAGNRAGTAESARPPRYQPAGRPALGRGRLDRSRHRRAIAQRGGRSTRAAGPPANPQSGERLERHLS